MKLKNVWFLFAGLRFHQISELIWLVSQVWGSMGTQRQLSYGCVVGLKVSFCGGPESQCSAWRGMSHARRDLVEESVRL